MLFRTGTLGIRSVASAGFKRALSSTSTNAASRAKVVVVGSGRMGQIRSSLIYGNPRFELCGIVDTNFEAASLLAHTFSVRRILADLIRADSIGVMTLTSYCT